jgi:hypothetical protein
LIALTTRGEKTVTQIVETEAALRGRLKLTMSSGRVARAAAVLRDVRLALENQLPKIVRGLRRRSDN